MKSKLLTHNPMKSSITLIICLLLCGAGFLNNSHAEDKKPVLVQGKFRIFPIGLNLSDINYLQGEKDIPVSIIADTPSPFYKLPTNGVIDFYRIQSGPDGKPQRIPVAQGNVALAGPLPLLIFSKTGADDQKLRVEAVKDDLQSFPLGTFLAINRCSNLLVINMNSKEVTLAPNSVTVLTPPPLEPGRRTVMFQIYGLDGSTKNLLYSNNWAFSTAARTMLVINPAVPPATQPSVSRVGEGIDALMEIPESPSARN